jgi:hypothetical protein
MTDESRERELESALFHLSERWPWRAVKFRQMITPDCELYKGGVWTVRHLLYTRETSGLAKLRHLPNLTVETLVLSGKWDDIFDEYDKNAARRKLTVK